MKRLIVSKPELERVAYQAMVEAIERNILEQLAEQGTHGDYVTWDTPCSVEYLSPLAKQGIEALLDLFNLDDGYDEPEEEAVDLLTVLRERDDLRRQLSAAREALEKLHRALYPGLHG